MLFALLKETQLREQYESYSNTMLYQIALGFGYQGKSYVEWKENIRNKTSLSLNDKLHKDERTADDIIESTLAKFKGVKFEKQNSEEMIKN